MLRQSRKSFQEQALLTEKQEKKVDNHQRGNTAFRHFCHSQAAETSGPTGPNDLVELASKVVENLIFVAYLPLVFHRQSGSEGEEKQLDYQEIVELVASEVYVAGSE